MGGAAKATIDHDFIRSWVEERGGKPAHVKGRGGPGDPGILRIDFPGFSGEGSLEEISWDEWFKAFDENNLAFLFQETTSGGQESRFNKLVSRDTVDPKDVFIPEEQEGEEERAEEEEEEEGVEASEEEEDENIQIEVSDELEEAVSSGEEEGEAKEAPRSQKRPTAGQAPEQQKKRRAG